MNDEDASESIQTRMVSILTQTRTLTPVRYVPHVSGAVMYDICDSYTTVLMMPISLVRAKVYACVFVVRLCGCAALVSDHCVTNVDSDTRC